MGVLMDSIGRCPQCGWEIEACHCEHEVGVEWIGSSDSAPLDEIEESCLDCEVLSRRVDELTAVNRSLVKRLSQMAIISSTHGS